jgi:hypothetical protein
VTPGPGLEAFGIDPGAEAQLSLGDLDFLIFALLILAAGTAGGSLICGKVRRVQYGVMTKHEIEDLHLRCAGRVCTDFGPLERYIHLGEDDKTETVGLKKKVSNK